MESDWIPWDQNPILTQRDLPRDRANPIEAAGHADFVQLPNGDWWAVFLAVRTFGEEGFYNTGRDTFLLSVDWPEGGWPAILEPGKEIPWRLDKPDLPEGPAGSIPVTGNFSWRDDFDSGELNLAWNFLRTPKGNWMNLDSRAGFLKLQPLNVSLNDLANPAWLARRVHHHNYSLQSRLLAPDAGVSAGLGLFIREDHHYFVGIRKTDTGYLAFLEKAENGAPEVVASRSLDGLDAEEPVVLSVAAEEVAISFYVELPDGRQLAIAEGEDATIFTTTRAWGFIGTMVGPHARLEFSSVLRKP